MSQDFTTRKKAWELFTNLVRGRKVQLLDDMLDDFGRGQDRCESQIEELMLAGLMFLKHGWQDPVRLTAMSSAVPSESFTKLYAQHKISSYRVDFMVEAVTGWPGFEPVRVIVECDGHDFHEKTKEQAARDKSRDRELTMMGYIVMRFTGSEIFKDTITCVEQVETVINQRIQSMIDLHLSDSKQPFEEGIPA